MKIATFETLRATLDSLPNLWITSQKFFEKVRARWAKSIDSRRYGSSLGDVRPSRKKPNQTEGDREMETTYKVERFVVSDANPSETSLNYGESLSPVGLLNSLASILAQDEEAPSKEFPQYDIRTTRIEIYTTRYLSV